MAIDLFPERSAEKRPLYFELKVREIVRETPDAITVVFEHPEGDNLGYRPGQFLTIIQHMDGREIRRAYSLCSSPFVDAYPAVTIKRVRDGELSNWLPDNLKVGDMIKVLRPMGAFTTDYVGTRSRHLVMFAGGSGITPLLSIIKSILVQENQSTISLVYCNRNVDSIIFKDQLDKLEQAHQSKLRIRHVLEDPPAGWQGYHGLLNDEALKELFNDLDIEPHDADTSFWLCGPEGMMEIAASFLSAKDIDKNRVFRERFVSGTIDKALQRESVEASREEKAHVVTIRYDGQDYEVEVKPGRHILESAIDMGIDLPYSCQSGMCTSCMGKALSGKVDLSGQEALTQSEIDQGYVLTCIGRPLTDDVVIEIS